MRDRDGRTWVGRGREIVRQSDRKERGKGKGSRRERGNVRDRYGRRSGRGVWQ